MTYLLLTALFVAALVFQAWMFSRERERWQEAQGRLLDRIQSPERVGLYEPQEMLPAVSLDDDEGFWAAKHEQNQEAWVNGD